LSVVLILIDEKLAGGVGIGLLVVVIGAMALWWLSAIAEPFWEIFTKQQGAADKRAEELAITTASATRTMLLAATNSELSTHTLKTAVEELEHKLTLAEEAANSVSGTMTAPQQEVLKSKGEELLKCQESLIDTASTARRAAVVADSTAAAAEVTANQAKAGLETVPATEVQIAVKEAARTAEQAKKDIEQAVKMAEEAETEAKAAAAKVTEQGNKFETATIADTKKPALQQAVNTMKEATSKASAKAKKATETATKASTAALVSKITAERALETVIAKGE